MRHVNINQVTHTWLETLIKKHHVIVDATVGNGHDTLFCAHLAKHVYGFDISSQAIKVTQARVTTLTNVTLFHMSHDQMLSVIGTKVDGFIYNLGYLPNSDKSSVTQAKTTIDSLTQASLMLADDGFICVTTYSKHQNGQAEADAVAEWLSCNMELISTYTYEGVEYAPVAYLSKKKKGL